MLTVLASGTPGTLTLQVSPDAGITWLDTEVVLTAAGAKNAVLGRGLVGRLSAVGASVLNAWISFGY